MAILVNSNKSTPIFYLEVPHHVWGPGAPTIERQKYNAFVERFDEETIPMQRATRNNPK
jgi:hypothetical protein